MGLARKDWNDHVAHAEEVARGRGFQGLRDEILEGAGATPEDVVVDAGQAVQLGAEHRSVTRLREGDPEHHVSEQGARRRSARNAVRVALGRGEQPARAEWWHDALERHGFDPIEVRVLEHEGGIALARRR